MRVVRMILVVLVWGLLNLPARADAPPALESLVFLLGDWQAEGGGAPGSGRGGFSFVRALADRVIVRKNSAEYPGSADRPATRHEDLMVIYAEPGGAARADYYDSEGHVIRYAISTPSPGEASFVSEAAADAPRFRLSYKLNAVGLLEGRFEIAPPGRPEAFSVYVTWTARRQGDAGQPAHR